MSKPEEYSVKKKYKRSDRKSQIKSKALRARNWKNVKKYAVKLVIEKGKKVAIVARMLGVSNTSIYNWIKEYKLYGKKAFNKKSKRPKKIKFSGYFLDHDLVIIIFQIHRIDTVVDITNTISHKSFNTPVTSPPFPLLTSAISQYSKAPVLQLLLLRVFVAKFINNPG